MVNNSTNINKIDNHLSWSPQTIMHKNATTTYGVDNPGFGMRQAQHYFGIKPVNDIPILIFVYIP